jgi:diguanylate cyclase (GGDEF)-like protein/PAS domain S-box-containing protein
MFALFLALCLKRSMQFVFLSLSGWRSHVAAYLLCASIVVLLAFWLRRNSNLKAAVGHTSADIAKITALDTSTEERRETDVFGIAGDFRKLGQAEYSLRESRDQYQLLVATIPEVVWKTDAKGNVIFVSPQVETLLGYSADEFRRKGDSLWFNSIHVDDKERVERAFELLMKKGEPYDIECRARRKNGEWFWAHDRAVATRDSNGLRVATGLISDISVRKAGEESERRYRSLFENMLEGFAHCEMVFDERGRPIDFVYLAVNSTFEELTGLRNVVGRKFTEIIPGGKDSNPELFERYGRVALTGMPERFEIEVKSLGMWFSISAYGAGKGCFVAVFDNITERKRDISERKLAEERVQFLAFYDALTGLPNRTLFQDRLTTALANARREKDKVALLFLDLDKFKDINDSLGHSVGDLLLKEVAKRLKTWGREQDTVARLGGDEFLITLTHVKDVPDVALAAERLIDAMTAGFIVQGHSLNVSCSIGISIFPGQGADGETLIKNADAAMYRAKTDGRNNFRFFTEDMNAEVMERVALEKSLRSALAREELFLMYQPQMDIANGRITGLEALLRWQHPGLGLVPPDRFIRIAENSGLIVPIGEWVVRTACRQARKWQDEGLPAVTVAVNVSAVQFRQADFCGLIKRVLHETGFAPQYLELELTEGLLLAEADVTLSVLKELKSMGVTLAIDDFGTGYSSFNYLRQFRVSKLKIDRIFIRDVAMNPDDAAITAAIISMAKSLNLKVIAEGVENEAQMSFLRAHQCDEIQGYYFSKPLAADKVADKLRGDTPKRQAKAQASGEKL